MPVPLCWRIVNGFRKIAPVRCGFANRPRFMKNNTGSWPQSTPFRYLPRTALLALTVAACRPGGDDPTPFVYPAAATTSAAKLLGTTPNGVNFYNGGFGTALARDPNDARIVYLLTGRGPGVESGGSVRLAMPTFTPQLGKFRVEGDSLKLIQTIELKDPSGNNLIGLPTNTGETYADMQGRTLAPSAKGINPAGLVALADGTCWVADEHGPGLVHFDAAGRMLERITPTGTGKVLPKVLTRRRTERGLTGLAMTPDGKTLVGIMESPLANPTAPATAASRTVRVLSFDLATGATRQFLYLLDNAAFRIGDLAALGNDRFLVVETDAQALANGVTPTKRLYQITLAEATDVSDPANAEAGRLVNGKTLDFATTVELESNGIRTVQKTFVLDLMQALPTFAHDHVQGLAVLSPTLLAISTNDEFGITASETAGGVAAKILPFTGKPDRSAVYFLKLEAPL